MQAVLMEVGLDDKYRLDAKRIFLSGTRALGPIAWRCSANAIAGAGESRTPSGFISGYRGSPLGMYDHALWRAKSFLKEHDIAFVRGLNEDLAATAVWGSQQVGIAPGAKVDGVFGIWYGKGARASTARLMRSSMPIPQAPRERWRDRAGRRRSWLPVLDAGPSERAGVRLGADAGGQSGHAARSSRPWHPRLGVVTLFGLLGSASRRSRETVESSASIVSDPDRIKIIDA